VHFVTKRSKYGLDCMLTGKFDLPDFVGQM